MDSFDLRTIGADLPAAELIDRLPVEVADPFPRLVVEAPPGTGKTTLVPPLIAEHLRTTAGPDSGRIVVTQPRRMAARAAPRRLAHLTGTRLGEDIGFTVRGESTVSARTRIEFVTTGVLLRRMLADPELRGVSAVILDEIHERHLDTDLVFAMGRELVELRDDLSLVVMSATLDARDWARRLGSPDAPAPVLSVAAQTHPLDVRWAPAPERPLDARGVSRAFLDHLARTTVRALDESAGGDVLVFAPGAREVDEVADRIRGQLSGSAASLGSGMPAVSVHTLTGRTSSADQDAILRPRSPDDSERRVIVTTSVAESALTVPGVSIVVDSGLARGPRLDTKRRMSGLVTTRESKASGVQRSGRAARLGPGVVYRCLSEADWASLPEHTPPEIATADLTSAVLDLASWGGDTELLPDPMPQHAWALAVDNLVGLGAVEVDTGDRTPPEARRADLHVTDLGRAIARVPASVWAARGLLDGAAMLGARAAAEAVAAVESDRRSPGADLTAVLRDLRASRDRRFTQDVDRFTRIVGEYSGGGTAGERLRPEDLGLVVALAFPHQIARARSGADAEYLLASGTAAALPRNSPLMGSPWLAIAEVGLAGGRPTIRSAVPIDADTAELAGAGLLATEESATFSDGKVRAVRRTRLGGIELTSTPITACPELAREAIARSIEDRGAREVLRPSPAFDQLRARLGLLRHVIGQPWPDVRWSHLAHTLPDWCPAALDRMARGADPGAVDLIGALRTLLPWPEAARLDELAPESIEVPSGSRVRLDYPDPDDVGDDDSPHGPVLAVKLQEVFGWTEVPRVIDGRVPVVLHLLSPRTPAAGGDERPHIVLGGRVPARAGGEPRPLSQAPVARGSAQRSRDARNEAVWDNGTVTQALPSAPPAPAADAVVGPGSRLSAPAWRTLREEHEAQVAARTDAHVTRRMAGEKHPVEDFLFTYYPFKAGQLAKWNPGAGVLLELETSGDREYVDRRWYRTDGTVAEVDLESWRADRGEGARFIAALLSATLDREANLGCFGLHEWAMVYRMSEDERRHQQVPLRLSSAETDAVVERHRIQCSHHDAFRFFTAAARPRNTLQPTRAGMVGDEQPGCLHAGMDLYKWAMKIGPIAPSPLVLDCFDLALDIRTLDMEASPYDLRGWGYGVVAIETAAGKAEYMERQQAFSRRAQALRRRLLDALAAGGIS